MMQQRLWTLLVQVLFEEDCPETKDELASRITSIGGHWGEFVSLANSSFVTGMLWKEMCRKKVDGLVPSDMREYLEAFSEINRERSNALRRQTLECIAALQRCSIPAMPIKGASYLLADSHRAVEDRFMTDIDIVVPGDCAARALSSLEQLDYEPLPHHSVDYTTHHHLPPMWRPGNPTTIEIHRAPIPSLIEACMPTSEIWENASSVKRRRTDFFLPNATDAMTILFAHCALVDRNLALLQIPLRSYLDAVHIATEYSGAVDWDVVTARADTIGERASVRGFMATLERLCQKSFAAKRSKSLANDAHFLLCRMAQSMPLLGFMAKRLDRLSAFNLRKNRIAPDELGSATAYRLKEIGSMLWRGARRIT